MSRREPPARSQPESAPPGATRFRKVWLRFALFVLLVAALATAGRLLALDSLPSLDEVRAAAAQWRSLGVVGFVGLYTLAVVALLPGSVLAIAAGALFGSKLGLLAAVLASNLGALLSFLIARGLGRDLVQRLLRSRLPRLEAGAATFGFEAILGLRLLSLVPFLNYASGLTAVRTRDFALASIFGMFPSTLLFVLLGANLDPTAPRFWVLALLVVLLAALPLLVRRRARQSAGG